ncbi:MAG: hypothetical protein V1733_09595 [bacterium]
MYPLKLHPNLTLEKWSTYSKTQQVLMISNELNRALNCLKSDHLPDAEKCYERAIELTDLTVEDPRWNHVLKELLRFREVLSDLFLSKNITITRLSLSILLSFNVDAYNMVH